MKFLTQVHHIYQISDVSDASASETSEIWNIWCTCVRNFIFTLSTVFSGAPLFVNLFHENDQFYWGNQNSCLRRTKMWGCGIATVQATQAFICTLSTVFSGTPLFVNLLHENDQFYWGNKKSCLRRKKKCGAVHMCQTYQRGWCGARSSKRGEGWRRRTRSG